MCVAMAGGYIICDMKLLIFNTFNTQQNNKKKKEVKIAHDESESKLMYTVRVLQNIRN